MKKILVCSAVLGISMATFAAEPAEIEAAIGSLRSRCAQLEKFEERRDEAERELERLRKKKGEIEKELRFLNRRPVVHNNDLNRKQKEREELVDTEIPAAEEILRKEEKRVEAQGKEVEEATAKLESFGEAAAPLIREALKDRKRNGGIAARLEEVLERVETEGPAPRDDYRQRPRR